MLTRRELLRRFGLATAAIAAAPALRAVPEAKRFPCVRGGGPQDGVTVYETSDKWPDDFPVTDEMPKPVWTADTFYRGAPLCRCVLVYDA